MASCSNESDEPNKVDLIKEDSVINKHEMIMPEHEVITGNHQAVMGGVSCTFNDSNVIENPEYGGIICGKNTPTNPDFKYATGM